MLGTRADWPDTTSTVPRAKTTQRDQNPPSSGGRRKRPSQGPVHDRHGEWNSSSSFASFAFCRGESRRTQGLTNLAEPFSQQPTNKFKIVVGTAFLAGTLAEVDEPRAEQPTCRPSTGGRGHAGCAWAPPRAARSRTFMSSAARSRHLQHRLRCPRRGEEVHQGHHGRLGSEASYFQQKPLHLEVESPWTFTLRSWGGGQITRPQP